MSSSEIYLASQSPRRQQLLRQLGVDFEVLLLRKAPGRPRDVEEVARDGEPALHYVERIARTKATVGGTQMRSRGLPPRPVLGADTEVVLDGEIFGKPKDAADAARMLARLSGRTHHVTTAIAIFWNDEESAEIVTSAVTFRALAEDEIMRYVATGEPTGKAGAYAIQGRAAAFISQLEGSYSGVMGLPLYETAAVLARIGFAVL
ncbi:MAG TPA: Maf family protein [Casimicrobiaceae bacterium]